MSDNESSSSLSASVSSSSDEEDGDIGAIKAQFADKRKEATNARKRRNRDIKKKDSGDAQQPKKARATKQSKVDTTKEKKPRKQPATRREEQIDKILQDYVHDKLQDLCPNAKITEQSCAILGDAIKAFIDEVTKRALDFSQETYGGGGEHQKRHVVGHQAAWGSVRTLVPSSMTPAVLKMSIDRIAEARGTQDCTEAAWGIYCSMSEQELQDYITRKMVEGM